MVGRDLEDGVDEDPGRLSLELSVVPPDHGEEVRDKTGTGVELDVRGEDEVSGRGDPGHVPGDVDWVVQGQPLLVSSDLVRHEARRLTILSLNSLCYLLFLFAVSLLPDLARSPV